MDRTVRVVHKTQEALGICSFELVAADNRPLPSFSAGSHIDVHLDGGLVRQYSLCNFPGERHRYQIAVLLDQNSRGGSRAMHAIEQGQTLLISGPRNHFPLAHEPRHSLLLAGGIGVTPILCMAQQLAASGASFEMHYCTRSTERTAFAERIRRSSFAGRVHLYHDEGRGQRKLALQPLLANASQESDLYVCGPTGFMDWVLGTARAAGWQEDRLHWEYFAATPVATSDDMPFEVQIASTGTLIPVAADQTVIAALAAAGISVPVSCEQGVCGTCVTGVIEGLPDHRDMYLTSEEQAAGSMFLPCCSRSKTPRLVLDL